MDYFRVIIAHLVGAALVSAANTVLVWKPSDRSCVKGTTQRPWMQPWVDKDWSGLSYATLQYLKQAIQYGRIESFRHLLSRF